MILVTILGALLIVSLSVNAFLLRRLKRSPKTESIELRHFLHDLTAGEALVRVQRISPVDVFLKIGG